MDEVSGEWERVGVDEVEAKLSGEEALRRVLGGRTSIPLGQEKGLAAQEWWN